jgi:HD superfamily phosphodiesterase
MSSSKAFRLLQETQDAGDQLAGDLPKCVPSNPLSRAAYTHVRSHLHPTILNHSMRVFIYAVLLSEKEKLPWSEGDRLPLLFTTAMFHDMGTADCCDGPQRFEVEGGDAAVAFLTSHGVSEEEAHQVWVAIACVST